MTISSTTSMEFAKHLTFAPQMKNGAATPFEQYIYLRYAQGEQAE